MGIFKYQPKFYVYRSKNEVILSDTCNILKNITGALIKKTGIL